jgi:hypothetical protein
VLFIICRYSTSTSRDFCGKHHDYEYDVSLTSIGIRRIVSPTYFPTMEIPNAFGAVMNKAPPQIH